MLAAFLPWAFSLQYFCFSFLSHLFLLRMTGFQHPDNGPYLLNNATTAGNQIVDLRNAPMEDIICENKTPCLLWGFRSLCREWSSAPTLVLHSEWTLYCLLFTIPPPCPCWTLGSLGPQGSPTCHHTTSCCLQMPPDLGSHLHSTAGPLVTKQYIPEILLKRQKKVGFSSI